LSPAMTCELYKIEYSHSCDIGGYYFSGGFEGEIYLHGHVAESPEDRFEEGSENGEGLFIPSLQRGLKQYIFRTDLVTGQTVEMLYFLSLLDDVRLIYPTGEEVSLQRLQVSHQWMFDDRREAQVELLYDLDEVLLSTACCIL